MGFRRCKLWVSQNPIVAARIVPRDLLKQIHSPLPTTGRELITSELAKHTFSV